MNPIACTIVKKEQVSSDIAIIVLQSDTSFQFTAGQYALLSFDEEMNGFVRPYSIGSASPSFSLEFHFKDSHTAEGFSHRMIVEKNVGDRVYVHGIQGDMVLAEISSRPVLMIAGGVGIAPFKAMIDSFEMLNRSIHLFWGCNKSEEFYQDDFLKKSFVKPHLCLADEEKQGFYHGFVSDAVLETFGDVSGFDVYLSGPLSMVSHAVDLLKERGLSKNNLFCDYLFDFKKT